MNASSRIKVTGVYGADIEVVAVSVHMALTDVGRVHASLASVASVGGTRISIGTIKRCVCTHT
jgi:hypothetical protein